MNEELKEHVDNFKAGRTVETVEMGGLGDSYEMIIQELAIDIMDIALHLYDNLSDKDLVEEIEQITDYVVKHKMTDNGEQRYEGITSVQVSAAQNIVAVFYKQGIKKGIDMMREKDPDRIIKINLNGIVKENK